MRWIHELARRRGYELVPVDRAAREQMQRGKRSYRELVISQALALEIGEISLRESRFLARLVRELDVPGPIVEIGTLFGWSTRVMLCAKAPERELISVDDYSWNPLGLAPDLHHQITSRILADGKELGLRQLRVDKSDFYSTWSGPPPALVFADAMHTYKDTKADIEWAQSAGAHVVCGHDYEAEWPGVIRAVDEHGGPRELVETLWVL
jgi:hypothetical protein